MINKEFANKWCENLKKYWLEKDIDNACNLFVKTNYYQETPFMTPFFKFEEIVNEWQHIKDEEIKKIEINILAVVENIIIANWYLEQNDDIFDGIYEIKFNEEKECIYFKSWEMTMKRGENNESR